MLNDINNFKNVIAIKEFKEDLKNEVDVFSKYLYFLKKYIGNSSFYNLFYNEVMENKLVAFSFFKKILCEEMYYDLINILIEKNEYDYLFNELEIDNRIIEILEHFDICYYNYLEYKTKESLTYSVIKFFYDKNRANILLNFRSFKNIKVQAYVLFMEVLKGNFIFQKDLENENVAISFLDEFLDAKLSQDEMTNFKNFMNFKKDYWVTFFNNSFVNDSKRCEISSRLYKVGIIWAICFTDENFIEKNFEQALKNGLQYDDVCKNAFIFPKIFNYYLTKEHPEIINVFPECISNEKLKEVILNGISFGKRLTLKQELISKFLELRFSEEEINMLLNQESLEPFIIYCVESFRNSKEGFISYLNKVKNINLNFFVYVDNEILYCMETFKTIAIKDINVFDKYYEKYLKYFALVPDENQLQIDLLDVLFDNPNLFAFYDNCSSNIEKELKVVILKCINENNLPTVGKARTNFLKILATYKMYEIAHNVVLNFILELNTVEKDYKNIKTLVTIEYLPYLLNINDEIKKIIFEIAENYTLSIDNVPLIFQDKEIVLKVLKRSDKCYSKLDKILKYDSDIVELFVSHNPLNLLQVPNDYENYEALAKRLCLLKPELFKEIEILHGDVEFYERIVESFSGTFMYLDDEFLTKDNFDKIKIKNYVFLEKMEMKTFLTCLNKNIFDIKDSDFCEFFWRYIEHNGLKNTSYKFPEYIIEFLEGNIVTKFLTIAPFVANCNVLNIDDFSPLFQQIINSIKGLYKETGKYNLFSHKYFSYEFITKVYPVLGARYSGNLLKYDTKALDVIYELLSKEGDLVKKVLNLNDKYDFFEGSDKAIHYLFAKKNLVLTLLNDAISNEDVINDEDALNIKRLLINQKTFTFFNIYTVEDLRQYKGRIKKFLTALFMSSKDSEEKLLLTVFLDKLAIIMGFGYFEKIKWYLSNNNLNDVNNFSYIYNIFKKHGVEYADLIFTRKEVRVINLLKDLCKVDSFEDVERIFIKICKDDIWDYSVDLMYIQEKVRKIYSRQFNLILSDIDSLECNKMVKDGVTLIDLEHEEFRFLIHTVNSFNTDLRAFPKMVIDNPANWNSLYGSNTLSMSTFSSLNPNFLKGRQMENVYYLFNYIPEGALFCMYPLDAQVSHELMLMEPVSSDNFFTDYDNLVLNSISTAGSYNEVATLREGMIPCAFLSETDKINEATIRAVKYFKDYTGKDIPVLIYKYDGYKNFSNIAINLEKEIICEITYEKLDKYIYFTSSIYGRDNEFKKTAFVINALNQHFNERKITTAEYIKYLVYWEKLLLRRYDTCKNSKFEVMYVKLYTEMMAFVTKIYPEFKILDNFDSFVPKEVKIEFNGQKYTVRPGFNFDTLEYDEKIIILQKAIYDLEKMMGFSYQLEKHFVKNKKISLMITKNDIVISEKEMEKLNDLWFVNVKLAFEKGYIDTILRHFVKDFVLGNLQASIDDFVIDCNCQMYCINQNGAFQYLNDESSLMPMACLNVRSRIGDFKSPIYYSIFKRYLIGTIDLDFSVIREMVSKLELITDDEYRKLFLEYSKLVAGEGNVVLNRILNRKKICCENLKEFASLMEREREQYLTLKPKY